ncbi:MAG TPA: DUF6443 domain-containing protein, partial [Chitinophagaceae bacterium]|nr:DUF6443 domain-containing protein [Chitinophagaceae bacterium]
MKQRSMLFKFSIALFLLPGGLYAQRDVPAAYNAAVKLNYVRLWDASAPEQDPAVLPGRPLRDVKQSTQYFDGFGRPLQTVVKQGSVNSYNAANSPGFVPTVIDMVSAIEYDGFGREQVKYLSFASTATDASKNDGSFKLNPFEQQASFYNNTDAVKNPIINQSETFFYGQTKFEASPLNRVEESFAAGNSWASTITQPLEADRKSIKTKYYFNTGNDVVR